MKQTINTDINEINRKALFWWRMMSKDWRLTMIHNPNVNKTDQTSLVLVNRSTSMIRRMFINWLNWDIKRIKEKNKSV